METANEISAELSGDIKTQFEMPIAVRDEVNPEIAVNNVTDYDNSLIELVKKYSKAKR